ncbi:MAG TPA: chemotaxis protein CheA [Bryobacteraceae bacterium]|nr:chemotaxis protein CheA [Bryobacteraceae bacterium]
MAHSTELRQLIEDLALRLIVAEPPTAADTCEWLMALQRIRDRAESDQASQLASATAALLESLSAAPDTGRDAAAQVMQSGIVRLQQILDGETVPPVEEPRPPSSLAQDPELLSDFVLESREHLASIESQLLILETDPGASEALNAVFRGFHTIKGLAGFLELWDVQKLAHETETVLDRARSSHWALTPDAIDVILESADHLRRWLTHLEGAMQGQQSDAPAPNDGLVQRIRALSADSTQPVEAAADLAALASAVETAPAVDSPAPSAEPARARSEAMAVKVDTAKLDYLVDMAGELVIAESLVRHDPDLGGIKSPGLQRKLAQMTRITAELQKTAMAMRLVPIGPLFRRMSRLVRDLSRQFGKQVRMETEGDDIELDRTIVEELADPLMHMVRNALDHGIEMPPERLAAGKSAAARLLLKAQHQSGQVVIEIADDGRGLDAARIRNKAVEKGLLAQEKALSENEIFNLIFEPGFTTAARITNVSGRGVGMDVVRRHIEKLRGRIEVRSAPGRGAAFLLKLPLTLAIIDGLAVGVGSERYILPLFAVREMFRPTAETIWTVQQRAEMALVRGNLLPVLRLYQRFGVRPRSANPADGVLVVAEVEGASYCLLVDELIGKQEVVIKSLGETFRGVTGIAGGAILGDGRVGLILDLDRLLKDGDHESSR